MDRGIVGVVPVLAVPHGRSLPATVSMLGLVLVIKNVKLFILAGEGVGRWKVRRCVGNKNCCCIMDGALILC
jgi:hypothetical protein